MKKTISILLLASFIMASTELHQLLKLPGLVHHFIQHQKEDTGISFIEFLNMHYAQNSMHKDDYQHDNLPFKSHCCMVNHTIFAETGIYLTNLEINSYFSKKVAVKYKEVFYASSIAESIWQPPKSC